MNNEKMIRIAAVIDRVLKIVQGFMVAGVIVSAIFIVLAFAVGEKIVGDASSLTFGILTLHLAEGALPDYAALRTSIVISLAVAIVMFPVGWYILRVVRQIMAPMKAGRPFEKGTAANIRKLGWSFLIGGAIIECGRMIGTIAELRAYDMGLLLNTEYVKHVDINYTMDMSFACIAVILFLLALVFSYGESLQQESDELL